MAEDKSIDDLQPAAWTPIGELPGGGLLDRLDFGDATRRAEREDAAEWEDADGPGPDEPLEMVDAPIQIRPPLTRADRKRTQRPLPM